MSVSFLRVFRSSRQAAGKKDKLINKKPIKISRIVKVLKTIIDEERSGQVSL